MAEQTAAADPFYKTCAALYAMYAATVLIGLSPYLWLVSTVILMAGIAMAYIHRGKAKGTFYESHFHWLIRTFWIGGGLYLPLLTLVAAVAITSAIDFTQVQEAVKAAALEEHPGDMSDQQVVVETVKNEIMTKHRDTIANILLICELPLTIWWLRRCWQGYQLLKERKPVEEVGRWT